MFFSDDDEKNLAGGEDIEEVSLNEEDAEADEEAWEDDSEDDDESESEEE